MASQNRLVMATPISSESPPVDGREVGENSRLEDGNEEETRDLGTAGANSLGNGDKDGLAKAQIDSDLPLKVNDILERFRQNTRARLKPSAQQDYERAFHTFANRVDFEQYSRRQLAAKKGKEIVLQFLQTRTKPSWRWYLATLKSVWANGIGLPWPINKDTDIGRLPPTRRRNSPRDDDVRKWREAISRETDAYLRLLFLLIAQHGWRPSHVRHLKWRNVQHDENGTPTSIIADGSAEDFKTYAGVAARLPPDVVQALQEWRKIVPAYPEHPIIPWRSCVGHVEPARECGVSMFTVQWERLRSKWDLPKLRPVDLRHWVASACRRAGLSKAASAVLMGHDAASGDSMRDWYDAPAMDDLLAEQALKLPNGPLGLLEQPSVNLVQGIPQEATEVMRSYLAGEIGTMEMASRLENVRMKAVVSSVGSDQVLKP